MSEMAHVLKIEGSDSRPYQIIPMCKCGWSGEVIDGQNLKSEHEARLQFINHISEMAKKWVDTP